MKIKDKRLQYFWWAAPTSCTITASTPSARLAWPSFWGPRALCQRWGRWWWHIPLRRAHVNTPSLVAITCLWVEACLHLVNVTCTSSLYWTSTAQSNTHLAKTAVLISMMTCRRLCSQNENFINIIHTRRREDHPKVAWFNKLSASKLIYLSIYQSFFYDFRTRSGVAINRSQWSKRDPQRTLPPCWLPWIRTFK